MEAHFILYVSDQKRSADYYREVLGLDPFLDVPGMTEFKLGDGSILGLMPEESASRLLGSGTIPPSASGSTPPVLKAELYLVVDSPGIYHQRALSCGGIELSPLMDRNWGHRAAYSVDRDGHVLAVAEIVG